jgi:hypothetical protein
MTQILTTIHLSDIQKELLAKVKAAPNSIVAHELISNTADNVDDNFVKAKETLKQLGIVKEIGNSIEITEKGLEVLTDENIIDESGELTEFGRQLADIDRNEISSQQPNQQQNDMGMEDPMGDGELPPMESFSLLKSINNEIDLLENINKVNKR